jgi:hypothetical protein
MSTRADGRIPDEVLLLMETSVDEWVDPSSHEMVVFRAVIENYRNHLETAGEPALREQLAATYIRLVAASRETLLDRARRVALERCTQGLPYTEAAA